MKNAMKGRWSRIWHSLGTVLGVTVPCGPVTGLEKIGMPFSTPGGGRSSPPARFTKRPSEACESLSKRPGHALQNLCGDCASGCAVHGVRGYSSLIVYIGGLPVRMNFGSKQVAKANSSLRAVSARRANHPDQCLHS